MTSRSPEPVENGAAPCHEDAPRRNPSGALAPDAARLRVLCVDDNPASLRLVSEVLRRGGCEVACAKDGGEAAARAAAERFDVLVTDHDMPVMNGLALVDHLRRAAFAGRIVVISASVDAVERAAYRARGVVDVLLKPVALPSLMSLVQGR